MKQEIRRRKRTDYVSLQYLGRTEEKMNKQNCHDPRAWEVNQWDNIPLTFLKFINTTRLLAKIPAARAPEIAARAGFFR